MLQRLCTTVFFLAVVLLTAEAACPQDTHLAGKQDAMAVAQPLRDGIACGDDVGFAFPPDVARLISPTLPVLILAKTGSEPRRDTSVCRKAHAPRAPPPFA